MFLTRQKCLLVCVCLLSLAACASSSVQKNEPISRPKPYLSQNIEETLLLQATQSFIRDYNNWNDTAYMDSINGGDPLLEKASLAYRKLVRQYAVAGTTHKDVAFSSKSSHDLENEHVILIEINGLLAIVKTKHYGFNDHGSDYEYHYKRTKWGWRLVDLVYVAENYRGSIL